MALRKAHGRAKKLGARVVVEQPPVDEQPEGRRVRPVRSGPGDRDEKGRFVAGNKIAARGGRATAEKARWRTDFTAGLDLGLPEVGEGVIPQLDDAREWARAAAEHIAVSVGGGVIGPDVGSLIQAAARAHFSSLILFRRAAGKGADPKLHIASAQLSDKARTMLLTARDLAAAAAEARPQDPEADARLLEAAFGSKETTE